MNTKLTLSLNKDVVLAAKKYAKAHQTSVSQIVENYFLDLIYSKPKKYPKIIEDMIGIAQVNEEEVDYKAAKLDYLTNKYLKD